MPYDESLDDVIIIDGVPVITEAKQQRLFETIAKRFRTQADIDVPFENMHIPYGEDGNSKGYIVMEPVSYTHLTLPTKA